MRRKIKYAILDDVEQLVVVTDDGYLATAHFNDEFIVVNWYSNSIPLLFNDDNIDETIWEYLDSGWRYWKDFHTKKDVDQEVIRFMLNKLSWADEYEKENEYDCFCEKDLKNFLYKNGL